MSNNNKNKDVQPNFLLNWATKNTKVGKRTAEKNKAIKKNLPK